jgi:ABC-type microcin C transport system permease subunit YejB
MRYALLIAMAYLLLMSAWVYAVADAGWYLPEALVSTVIVGAQAAVGFLVGRWWTSLLPALVVLISIPAGISDAYPTTEFPIWFGAMFGAAFAIPLVLLGVVARKVIEHVRGPRVPIGHA